jgi:hypothetical protein
MTDRELKWRENGHFEGLDARTKRDLVLKYLSADQEMTLEQLKAATGLTTDQAHAGIKIARKQGGRGCIVTLTKGRMVPTYKLATQAEHVNDYAMERMNRWRGQIKTVSDEMEQARSQFPTGWSNFIDTTASAIGALLRVFNNFEAGMREIEAEREKLEAERRKFAAQKAKAGARR